MMCIMHIQHTHIYRSVIADFHLLRGLTKPPDQPDAVVADFCVLTSFL